MPPPPSGPVRAVSWADRLTGNLVGIGLMIASTLCMSAMFVAMRKVPGDLHPFEVAFFRNGFGLLALTAWYAPGGMKVLRTRRLRLHAVRAVLNVVAMLAFFTAVFVTPLADLAALGFAGPLFASVWAVVLLRERPGWHRAAVMAFGFAGALVILRPGLTVVHTGPLLVLFSASVWSVALMVIKVLARTESSTTIAMYMVLFMTPLSGLAAAAFWQTPDAAQLAWLALVGVLGTAGQINLGQSFRVAEATAVLPLDFFKLVWGSLLGFVFFTEVPDLWTWVGGTMIFASSTWLALREARRPGGASADGGRRTAFRAGARGGGRPGEWRPR